MNYNNFLEDFNESTHNSSDCFLLRPFNDPSESIYFSTLVPCILNCLFCIPAVLGNVAILGAITCTKTLQTSPNILLCWLCVTDMSVGLVVQPCFVVHQIFSLQGKPNCSLYLFAKAISTFFFGLSLITLSFVVMERYLSIIYPYKYIKLVTIKRLLIMVSFNWITWIITFPFFAKNVTEEPEFNYFIFGATLFIIVTVVVQYFQIFSMARKQTSRIATLRVAYEPQTRDIKKEKRIAVMMFFVIINVLICYFPIMCCILIQAMDKEFRDHLNLVYMPWCEWLAMVNSSTNPVLILWRSVETRRTIIHFLTKRGLWIQERINIRAGF